jgi:hypothetical protein
VSFFRLGADPFIHRMIILTVLVNEFPGKRSVNKVEKATIEKAMISANPTDAPIDWVDSDHVICVSCRSMSVPKLYK